MVSLSTKKAAVYDMNSDIPLTCPRPLEGRGHVTLVHGDSNNAKLCYMLCCAQHT